MKIKSKEVILRELEKEDWKGDVPILISPKAKEELLNFLYNDCMGTGEGYSLFILKAIELRRKIKNGAD